MRPTLIVEEWRGCCQLTYLQIYEMMHGGYNVMMSEDWKDGSSRTVDRVPDGMWFMGRQKFQVVCDNEVVLFKGDWRSHSPPGAK